MQRARIGFQPHEGDVLAALDAHAVVGLVQALQRGLQVTLVASAGVAFSRMPASISSGTTVGPLWTPICRYRLRRTSTAPQSE